MHRMRDTKILDPRLERGSTRSQILWFDLCKRLLLSQNSLTEQAKDPHLTKTIMKLFSVLLLLFPLFAAANVRRGDKPDEEVRSLQEVMSCSCFCCCCVVECLRYQQQ
jgi:hypothetical protein